MKRILVLQFIPTDPPGYLEEIMKEYCITYDVVDVAHSDIPNPQKYEAFIGLGGTQHVGDNNASPYIADVAEVIREVVNQNMPYLGICLGGQLLAYVLGAQVYKHTRKSIGFYKAYLTEEGKQDNLFKGISHYQQVIQWNEDVFNIPRDAVRLATSPNTANQAFRYGYNAYGVQYHIELTPDMLDTWLSFPGSHEEIIHALGEDGLDIFLRDRKKLYELYQQHTRIMFENFLRISNVIE